MASVVLSGDTSGSVSLTVPAVAGTNTITFPAATGNGLTDVTCGVCRAWVNFNGTGTVAIRASFNVSSITDNGTGDYTLNFTTAMPDADYSAVANAGQGTNSDVSVCGYRETISTSAYRMKTIASNATVYVDAAYVGVTIHR